MKKVGWTTNSMDDIGISTYISAKQCDIRSFFVEPYIGCPCPPMPMGFGWAWVGMVHGMVHVKHGR